MIIQNHIRFSGRVREHIPARLRVSEAGTQWSAQPGRPRRVAGRGSAEARLRNGVEACRKLTREPNGGARVCWVSRRSLSRGIEIPQSQAAGFFDDAESREQVLWRGSGLSMPHKDFIGWDSIWTAAGFKPWRVAVNVMEPGWSIERIATRLMPHSVSR